MLRKFRNFCNTLLEKHGNNKDDMTTSFMAEKVRPFFAKARTRELMRIYHAKKKADRVETLELGTGGSKRKKGEHSIKRQHLGLGVRELCKEPNRKSALWSVFAQVKTQFEQWRMAGHYVDKFDLLCAFDERLDRKINELETKLETGGLNHRMHKVLEYAYRRKASHAKGYLIVQSMGAFDRKRSCP